MDLKVVLVESQLGMGEYAIGDIIRGHVQMRVPSKTSCKKVVVNLHRRVNRGGLAKDIPVSVEVHQGALSEGTHQFPFELPVPEGVTSYRGKRVRCDIVLEGVAYISALHHERHNVLLKVHPAQVLSVPFGFAQPLVLEPAENPHTFLYKAVLLFLLLGIYSMVSQAKPEDHAGAFFWALVLGAVSLFCLYRIVQNMRDTRLARVHVHMERPCLFLGQTETIKVSFEPRIDLGIKGAVVELLGCERAMRNKKMKSFPVHTQEIPLGVVPKLARKTITFWEVALQLPEHLPFTMGDKFGEVFRWELKVSVKTAKWGTITQEFELPVAPRLIQPASQHHTTANP